MQTGVGSLRVVARMEGHPGDTCRRSPKPPVLPRLLALSSLAALLLSSRLSFAQADGALARALFRQARVLMEQGDYPHACPKFEESQRLDAGIGTQFNLANCWEKLGRTASAWALYLDVAAAARAQGMTERAEAARRRADAVESSLTRLNIVVPATRGLRLTLDGKDLKEAAWSTEIPVDPGPHVLAASAPDRRNWAMTVEAPVQPGTLLVQVPALAASAELQPEREQRAPERAPADPLGPGDAERGGSALRTWSWISGGLGGAAIAAGVVFRLQMSASIHDAKQLCNGGLERNECVRDRPAEPDAAWDGGAAEKRKWEQLATASQRERALSYAGFGVGAAAVVTSVVLYLASDGRGAEEGSSISFYPEWSNGFRGTVRLSY